MTFRIVRILLIAGVLFDAFLIGHALGRTHVRSIAHDPEVIVAPVSVGLRV